jgi:hypothetical protein
VYLGDSEQRLGILFNRIVWLIEIYHWEIEKRRNMETSI